jgi:cation transport regulator ChaB
VRDAAGREERERDERRTDAARQKRCHRFAWNVVPMPLFQPPSCD